MRFIGFVLLVLIIGCTSKKIPKNNIVKSHEVLPVSVLNNGFNVVFDDGYEVETIHIDSSVNNIDLYYLNSFDELYLYLPPNFHNTQLRDTTIIQANGEGNYKTVTGQTYDSISNVVFYYDIPCFVCSYMYYNYEVQYNLKNQVIKFGDESIHYIIKYDSSGDIRELLRFSNGDLDLTVNINKIY